MRENIKTFQKVKNISNIRLFQVFSKKNDLKDQLSESFIYSETIKRDNGMK